MAAKLKSYGRILRQLRSRNSKELKLTAEVVPLALLAGVSAAAFIACSVLVAKGKTRRVDMSILEHTSPGRNHPVRKVARALSPIGNWKTNLFVASGIAALIGKTNRVGGLVVLGTALAGFGLNNMFDELFPQPPAPPGQASRFKPVYPSGHTLGPAAIGLTAAHLLAREGRANGALAFPIAAAIPVVLAAGRMVDAHHWASDILGGYLGGVSLAASGAAVFERFRSSAG